MRIVDERSLKLKLTAFSNMKLGTVFIDEDDDLSMKIRECNNEVKAVNLATGKVFDPPDDYKGVVVEATLIMK